VAPKPDVEPAIESDPDDGADSDLEIDTALASGPGLLPTAAEIERKQRDPRRLIVFGIVTAVAALLFVSFLYIVRNTLVMAYIAGVLAMGISPLVRIIERQKLIPIGHRLPRWLAILIIYAGLIGTIAIILMIVIPPLANQAEELWRNLPDKIARGQEFLIRRGILREPITIGDAVSQAPASGGATAVGTIFSTLRNVAGGIFGVITLLLLTFYMLVESREITSFFVRLFPRHQRPRVAAVSATVTAKVSAWLGGQLLLSMIIGVTSAIGLGLMGVPYFYVLALISAVGEMIPMIGPILSAIPAILVAATVSPTLAIGVAVFFIVQQQVENTILVPKIMGRQVGLSAVTVILALGMGGALLGVVGAILSLPTAAIVQVLFEELVARDE
jgi:predicted PurR-regulated permease PerM